MNTEMTPMSPKASHGIPQIESASADKALCRFVLRLCTVYTADHQSIVMQKERDL